MRRVIVGAMAGSVSGFVVLGVGGRVLMRLLASFTPEDPRFTWLGLLQIVGLAAAWGFATGPLILVASKRVQRGCLIGPVFGLAVFVLAAIPFILFSGFSGRIVAPASFLVLSAVSFPVLFVVHGIAVDWLHNHWSGGC